MIFVGYFWCPNCGAIRKTITSYFQNEIRPVWKRWIYPKGKEKTYIEVGKLQQQEAKDSLSLGGKNGFVINEKKIKVKGE